MLVEDVGAPRAELAERVLRRSLGDGRPAAVVAFAGTAARTAAVSRAAGVPDEWPELAEGSDVGEGLVEAGEALLSSLAGGRLVVVLTDGADHAGRAAAEAGRLDAEVLAVVVGTEAGGPVPGEGGPLVYEGEEVRSRAEATPWADAAVRVRSAADVAEAAVLVRGAARGLDAEAAWRRSSRPLYPWLAGLAAGLLVAESLPRRALAAAGVALLMGVTDAESLMRRGQSAADAGRWAEAAAAYREAAAIGDSAVARFNAGTAAGRAALAAEPADLEAAVADLREAVRLRPDWEAARVNLQLVYRLSRQERDGQAPPGPEDGPPESDGEGSSGESPGPASGGGAGGPDPFRTERPELSEADVERLLESARGLDEGGGKDRVDGRSEPAGKPW